jgi:hypothetical protein
MKYALLFPVIFGLLLSGCQPRDVQVVPEGERAKGKARASSRDSFLGNNAMAAHIVERQVELMMAIDTLHDGNAGESFGFVKVANGVQRAISRDESTENFKKSRNERDFDQWFEKSDKVTGSSTLTVFGNQSNTKIKTVESSQKPSPADLKISEVRKATVKRDGDIYDINYQNEANVSKGSDSYTFSTTLTFKAREARKDGQKGFIITDSKGSMKVSKAGDGRYTRNMYVVPAEGMFISLDGCAYADGNISFSYKIDQNGNLDKPSELVFSKSEIKESSSKKNAWSDEFLECKGGRPVVDFHRLLR